MASQKDTETQKNEMFRVDYQKPDHHYPYYFHFLSPQSPAELTLFAQYNSSALLPMLANYNSSTVLALAS